MAEFVQRRLEEFLDVFTELQKNDLLKKSEVKGAVQRIRHYNYSISKLGKNPQDYIRYAEYLRDLLRIIKIRRQNLDYHDKTEVIELKIKHEAAFLYRCCTDRFKKLEYFKHEISFLKEVSFEKLLSGAYNRLLQLHGSNPRNHEEAGTWEFFGNHSAENSRVIFQVAVRKFPTDLGLWIAFFEMEVSYVLMLAERRVLLLQANDEDKDHQYMAELLEGISDDVLKFKLAEVVVKFGAQKVREEDRDYLLFKFYWAARKHGKAAEAIADVVYSLLWPDGDEIKTPDVSEEAFLVRELKNSRQLPENEFEFFKSVYSSRKTPKMIRLFISVCVKVLDDELLSIDEDVVKMTLLRLFEDLHETGQAGKEDYGRYVKLAVELDMLEDEAMIDEALKMDGGNVDLWERILAKRIEAFKDLPKAKRTEAVVSSIQVLLDQALQAVHPTSSLPIWKAIISFSATQYAFGEMEKVFKAALIKTTGQVHGELKRIWLDYVRVAKPDDIRTYRDEFTHLSATRPCSLGLYLDYVQHGEEEQPDFDAKRAAKVLDRMVAEHGSKSPEAWLAYGKFAIKHDVLAVGGVYERASINLEPQFIADFNEKWTLLVKSSNN